MSWNCKCFCPFAFLWLCMCKSIKIGCNKSEGLNNFLLVYAVQVTWSLHLMFLFSKFMDYGYEGTCIVSSYLFKLIFDRISSTYGGGPQVVLGEGMGCHSKIVVSDLRLFSTISAPTQVNKARLDAIFFWLLATVALSFVFGKKLSNYGLFRFKRFVSSITDKLCNQLFFLPIFNAQCMCRKI